MYGEASTSMCAFEHVTFWVGNDCKTTCFNFAEGFAYEMGMPLTFVASVVGDDEAQAVVTVQPAVDGEEIAGLAAYDVDLTAAAAPSPNSVYVSGSYNYAALPIPATWTRTEDQMKAEFAERGIYIEKVRWSL